MIQVHSNRIFYSLLIFCLLSNRVALFAQGFAADWPATHKNDLSKWAAKTGLSFHAVDKLARVATKEDAEGEEEYFWYSIENLDATTLHQQKLIFLSTWAAGTGHCMTLYVLRRTGSKFEKIWQSEENLCTESVLGAARSQVMPDGRIIVRFRDHSQHFDPEKENEPRILKVKITYKWDGSTYMMAGRIERPEPRER